MTERPLWHLTEDSLAVLTKLLPSGVTVYEAGHASGWVEDFTVYEDGLIRFGVISHEHTAYLRIDDNEMEAVRGLGLEWEWPKSP